MTRDLIRRLESAKEGSRELDIEIWDNVEAWPVSPDNSEWRIIPSGNNTCLASTVAPPYTTSIDAALTLVPEGYSYSLGAPDWSSTDNDGPPSSPAWANLFKGRSGGWNTANGVTPALALCIASLKAREKPHG